MFEAFFAVFPVRKSSTATWTADTTSKWGLITRSLPQVLHKACTRHAWWCLAQHWCAVAVLSPSLPATI